MSGKCSCLRGMVVILFSKCRKWTYSQAKQITPCLGWAWMGSGWNSILSSNQLLYTSNLRCNSEHLHPLFPNPSVQLAFIFHGPTCMGVSTRKPSTSTLRSWVQCHWVVTILIMNQPLTIVTIINYYGKTIHIYIYIWCCNYLMMI